MWARDVEIMLACWLAMSPFIFGHPADKAAWWINDFACAVLIVFLASASYWRALRKAHLGLLLIAGWLIGFAYLQQGSDLVDAPSPAMQNELTIGLLLLMFGIVPNHASDPPLARLPKSRTS